MSNEQLVLEIERTAEIWGITQTARALQTSIPTLRRALKSGKVPHDIAARWAEIEAERARMLEERETQLGLVQAQLLEEDEL